MPKTLTTEQRDAQRLAADKAREASDLIARAEALLTSARDDLRAAKAWRCEGDLADFAYRLGDRGDAECGTLAENAERIALVLHTEANR